MTQKLRVHAQGPIGRWADERLEWAMRYVSGAPTEAPQRTHRWNNIHLKVGDVSHLSTGGMVAHQGKPDARKVPKVPILSGALAHATKYGGWKHYLVLQPADEQEWHIGWCWSDGAGVSRVIVRGPVRVLIGPNPAKWFGIAVTANVQIPLVQIGEGRIGDGGPFSHLPLF